MSVIDFLAARGRRAGAGEKLCERVSSLPPTMKGDALWRTVNNCVETCAGIDHEIVVADDGSCDGSLDEVFRRFPRVRIARHERRLGPSPTKHLGAEHSRGDVLVFLDGHTKPEPGSIRRLATDVEEVGGRAIVTPTISGLDVGRWKAVASQTGHGYRMDLKTFQCGWLPLSDLNEVTIRCRKFYESPALIGCAFAVSRDLYEDLWGFDPHMRCWGVEDLDFSLKCWLMGYPVLHDPGPMIAHRFRERFDGLAV